MNKQSKLLLFTIIVAVAAISLIVYRYEGLLKKAKAAQQVQTVKGGTPSNKEYTAPEIFGLIKASKEYLGDSVTIFDNGDMLTTNSKFQGTLLAVATSEDNMSIVNSNMSANKLPLQYNIYVLAATYYRRQYPNEFKTDSLR